MRIGIVSDSHDHVWNLRAALDVLRDDADVLVHCGDLCAPFVVPLLAAGFPGPVHAVFGNNDADRFRLQLQAQRTDGRVRLEGESWLGELAGLRVAVHHFPDVAEALAASGRYDLVCTGHDHRHRVDRVGAARFVNPGSILGFRPGDGDVAPSFVIVESGTGDAVTWRLHDGVFARERG